MAFVHRPPLKEAFALIGYQWLCAIALSVLIALLRLLFPSLSAGGSVVAFLLGSQWYAMRRKKRPELLTPPARLRWFGFYSAFFFTLLLVVTVGLAQHFHWLGDVSLQVASREELPSHSSALLIALGGFCVFAWTMCFFSTWLGLHLGRRAVR